MIRRVVVFSGRVQGVGFRATALGCARAEPVSGWVRNEHDGTVRMEVQGEAAAVERTLARLRGAMGRHISSEHAHEAPPIEGEPSFTIQR